MKNYSKYILKHARCTRQSTQKKDPGFRKRLLQDSNTSWAFQQEHRCSDDRGHPDFYDKQAPMWSGSKGEWWSLKKVFPCFFQCPTSPLLWHFLDCHHQEPITVLCAWCLRPGQSRVLCRLGDRGAFPQGSALCHETGWCHERFQVRQADSAQPGSPVPSWGLSFLMYKTSISSLVGLLTRYNETTNAKLQAGDRWTEDSVYMIHYRILASSHPSPNKQVLVSLELL